MIRAAAVGLAVVVAAACSDGPTIEKAELLERGDEICRQARTDVQRRLEEASADGASSETGLIREILLPGVRDMFDEIQALGSPPGDGDELADVHERIDALLADATEGQLGPAEFDQRYDAILADLQDYGFTDCAEGGGGT